jgi:hypothetical protein
MKPDMKKLAEAIKPKATTLPDDPYFNVHHLRQLRGIKDEDNLSKETLQGILDCVVGILADEINELPYKRVKFIHPGYSPWEGNHTDIYWYEGILLRVTFEYRSDMKMTWIAFDCMVEEA